MEFIFVYHHGEDGKKQRRGVIKGDGSGQWQHGDAIEEQHQGYRAGNAAPQMIAPIECSNSNALLAHDEIDQQQSEKGTIEHQFDMGKIGRAKLDEHAHAAEQKSGDQHPE
jgi:hypothetical protein